jgi:predicted ester cyclase
MSPAAQINLTEHTKSTLEQIHHAIKVEGFLAQADFFAEQHINHGLPSTREQTTAVLQDIAQTFPDVELEPIQVMYDGEWAIGHYWFRGTHKGMARHPYVHCGLLAGVEPTGKCVRVSHVHVFRIQNGQITEHSGTRDDVAMVKQLGLGIRVDG